MATRTIREYGDDVLTKKCKPVSKMTPRNQVLIDDMIETMYEANGVGLAAPQVGVLKQIVVIDVSGEEEDLDEIEDEAEDAVETGDENEAENEAENRADGDGLLVLINPEIIETSGEQTGREGCLSVPGKFGIVTRPNYVKVRALDRDMNEIELEGEGLLARAFCHEIDHLSGKMFVDLAEDGLHDLEELLDDEDDEADEEE